MALLGTHMSEKNLIACTFCGLGTFTEYAHMVDWLSLRYSFNNYKLFKSHFCSSFTLSGIRVCFYVSGQ